MRNVLIRTAMVLMGSLAVLLGSYTSRFTPYACNSPASVDDLALFGGKKAGFLQYHMKDEPFECKTNFCSPGSNTMCIDLGVDLLQGQGPNYNNLSFLKQCTPLNFYTQPGCKGMVIKQTYCDNTYNLLYDP